MDLKEILAVSGKPGLYKFISQGRNNVLIIENLEDKKRTTAFSTSKISFLEDISIFTTKKDMPLKNVFKAIFEKEDGGAAITHKSSGKELERYLKDVVPEYDQNKVYVSDIKKVIQWYNILQKLDILDFSEEDKEDEDEVKEKSGKSGENKKVTEEKKTKK